MNDVLGKILIDCQILTPSQVHSFESQAEKEGCHLEQLVLREGYCSREALLKMLENHYFCPAVDVRQLPFDARALTLLPEKLARRHGVLPVNVDGSVMWLAVPNPDDKETVQAVASVSQRTVKPVVGLRGDLGTEIASRYERLAKEAGAGDAGAREKTAREKGAKKKSKKKAAGDGSAAAAVEPSAKFAADFTKDDAVVFVEEAIRSAVKHGISDIHLQPEKNELVLRYRLDGIMHRVISLPADRASSIVSRIKVIADMDITERRLPQDGRYTFTLPDTVVDLRISTLPAKFGEKVVIRLLTKDLKLLDLDNLQLPPSVREGIDGSIESPEGFYLVTGPTGSGKTTTLYAVLSAIDRERLNVITLEDPVEYTLSSVTQVQINDPIGLTFAAGLRTVLRQDPDVVLVGEIRDLDTVEIACRAALTGHKVYSTIHTNDSCQTVTRLINMGTAPYLITATLRGVFAQRLIRVICEKCRELYEPTETELALLGYPKIARLHRGTGCTHCAGTGYRGRTGVFEYLRIHENLHPLILDRASPYVIRHAAKRNGAILMDELARRLVLDGTTTASEIQRVVWTGASEEQLCSNCQRAVSTDFTVCPFCQHHLRESCPACGAGLDQSWEACPSCGHEIEREWQRLFCKKCMAPVDPGWTSCNYCGADL